MLQLALSLLIPGLARIYLCLHGSPSFTPKHMFMCMCTVIYGCKSLY